MKIIIRIKIMSPEVDEIIFNFAPGKLFQLFISLLKVSQPCTDMLHYCIWHGNQTDCERIFNPTMTDEGICCNFNSVTKKYLFYNA